MEGSIRCSANYVPLTPISFLERAALVYGDRPSVVYGNVKYTWRETFVRCTKLASALTDLPISYGDVVSFFSLFSMAFFCSSLLMKHLIFFCFVLWFSSFQLFILHMIDTKSQGRALFVLFDMESKHNIVLLVTTLLNFSPFQPVNHMLPPPFLKVELCPI